MSFPGHAQRPASWPSRAGQLAEQPCLRGAPVAADGIRGDSEYFGRLLEAESAEEPHLHHLHFAGIQRAETSERFVQRDEIDIRPAPQEQPFIKRDLSPVAAALLRLAFPSKVDEATSYQPGGDGEEMRPILPLDSTRVSQPEIGLVHELGCLQGMPRALACHVDACQPMEFVVNERREAGQSVLIAAAPGEQQLGDIARRSRRHEEWQERRNYMADAVPTNSSALLMSRASVAGSGPCGSRAPVCAYQGRQNPCDWRSTVKILSLLVACCLTLSSTLLMKASTVDALAAGQNPHGGAELERQALECGGEPCDAVARGLRAFFDRRPKDLGNGRACADCHMATDNFQLAPASVEARFRLLQVRRRSIPVRTIRCSARLMPTISA